MAAALAAVVLSAVRSPAPRAKCQVSMHGIPLEPTIDGGGCLPRACSAAICCRSASTSLALVSAGASGMVLVVAVQGTARSCLLLNGATQCRARKSLSGRRAYIRQLPVEMNVHQKSAVETLITCLCQTHQFATGRASNVLTPCLQLLTSSCTADKLNCCIYPCIVLRWSHCSMVSSLAQSFAHGVFPCVWPSSTGRCAISAYVRHMFDVSPHPLFMPHAALNIQCRCS